MALAPPRPGSSCSRTQKPPGQIRDVSKTLTAERRDKLLALQRREQMKEVLIDKFKKCANLSDCPESVINQEVTNFCKKAKVTEANLNRLERRIRGRKNQKEEEEGVNSDPDSDAGEGAYEDLVSNYSAPSIAPSQVSRTSSLSQLYRMGHRVPDDYDWSRIDEYAMFLHEEDAIRAKKADKEMKDNLKSFLDVQVAEREQKKKRRAEDEQKYYDNLLIELEDWEVSEKQKQDDFKEKMAAERRSRDAQLEYDRELKEAEAARKKQEEEALMKQIEEEIIEEKDRLLQKKAEEKKAIMKVFQENMADKKLRDEEMERQRAADYAEQQKALALMEADEAKRQAEAEERDGRQKALIEKMKTEVQSAQKAQGQEDAIRAKMQQDELNKRAQEVEKQKKLKLEELRHETQDYLFMQMAEKDNKKRNALELKDLQACVLKEDAEQYKVAEADKVLQRKLRNLENRAQLETQIQDKHSQKSKLMSDSEITMNLDLINVVEQTLKERDSRQVSAPAKK